MTIKSAIMTCVSIVDIKAAKGVVTNAARAPSARVSASAPPYLCVWSRLSHSLVYFHHRMAVLDRVRPKLGFGYGFGAETAKFLGFGLVSVTAVTRNLVSA